MSKGTESKDIFLGWSWLKCSTIFLVVPFLNSFQDVLLLHILVYMSKFVRVGSGEGALPSITLFILHSTVGASVCMVLIEIFTCNFQKQNVIDVLFCGGRVWERSLYLPA